MARLILLLSCICFFSCKGKTDKAAHADKFEYQDFSALFKEMKVPYQISDTDVLSGKDTTVIRFTDFAAYMPDSLKLRYFGKAHVRYLAIAKIPVKAQETYYVVKAISGAKKVAFLFSFDRQQKQGAVLPFLVPDNDPSTVQSATIDKAYTISRNIVRRRGDVVADGKEVYIFDRQTNKFTLIMRDQLDAAKVTLENPIDTFPKKNKFSGDYAKDLKNIVSIRDANNAGQLIAFVHMENEDGTCTGELKGTLLFTSPTTAIYRQGGDPCVLTFRFEQNSVTLVEEQGCGSHRGLDCKLEGRFSRKKILKAKNRLKSSQKQR